MTSQVSLRQSRWSSSDDRKQLKSWLEKDLKFYCYR